MTESYDDTAELDFEKIRNYTMTERRERFFAYKASLLKPPTVHPTETIKQRPK